MKRTLFSLVALLVCTATMQAQDLLTNQSGEQIRVIVKEIDSQNVKYVLFSEPDGVLYVVPKSEVMIIHYASGRKEVFTNANLVSEQAAKATPPHPGNFYYVDYGGGAHIRHGMKYAELKNIYHHRNWQGGYERYSPGWSGVGSFFIPGLGQMCCNEVGRGLFQMGANVALGVLSLVALVDGDEFSYLVCSSSRLALGVWSIIDAVRVARVKNMYENDLLANYYSDISVDMYPSLNPVYSQSGLGVAPGMTLAITF